MGAKHGLAGDLGGLDTGHAREGGIIEPLHDRADPVRTFRMTGAHVVKQDIRVADQERSHGIVQSSSGKT